MKISELIERLEKIKNEEGDIPAVTSEPHEYWGSVYSHLTEYEISITSNAAPDGPKSGIRIKAVVLG